MSIKINEIEYFPTELGIKKHGIISKVTVYSTDPGMLEQMIHTHANTKAEEMAEKKFTELVTNKVINFLKK